MGIITRATLDFKGEIITMIMHLTFNGEPIAIASRIMKKVNRATFRLLFFTSTRKGWNYEIKGLKEVIKDINAMI